MRRLSLMIGPRISFAMLIGLAIWACLFAVIAHAQAVVSLTYLS